MKSSLKRKENVGKAIENMENDQDVEE